MTLLTTLIVLFSSILDGASVKIDTYVDFEIECTQFGDNMYSCDGGHS